MDDHEKAFQGGSTKRRAYHCLQFVSGEQRKKGHRHDSGHPLPNSSHLLIKFVESERKHSLYTSVFGDVDLVLLIPTKPCHTDEPGVCSADSLRASHGVGPSHWHTERDLEN